MYLDIGPKTVQYYKKIIKKAKNIFWNGPMGYFEVPDFEKGTKSLAREIAKSNAVSIVAGGDTETIVSKYKLDGQFSYVSTGGGAALEFLAGKQLPVLKYLTKKEK